MAKLFSDLIGFLNAHPILWGYMVLGFATWIASIVVVLTSRMFLRKGLWLLLTLLSFTFSWGIGPGETLSLGIPLGSLIILGRRLFGRGPTAEEREDWEARRRLALAGSPAYAWRVWLLRTSYSLAVVATVVVGGLAASGAVFDAMGPEVRQQLGGALLAMQAMQALFVLLFAGLFAYLAARPWWWGKLLLAWAALAWTMFGLIGQFMLHGPVVTTVLVCGLLMLVAVVATQIADPRFSGPYLRTASEA